VPGLAGDHSTLHINVWDTEILKKGMNPTAHLLHDGLPKKKTLKCREKGNVMDKLMWWVIICSIGIEQAMMYLFPERRFELTFQNEGYLIACKDVHGTL
jgi:hypothetical protein